MIDVSDAQAIQTYYINHVVSGLPYSGEIGQMQTYTIYVDSLSFTIP